MTLNENVYILITLAGLVTVTVLLYLKWLAHLTVKATYKIIELNEKLKYDPYRFVNEVFPLLKKVEIVDMAYKISYPGTEFERKKTSRREGLTKSLSTDDYSIYIEIVPKRAKGEIRYIYILVLETLFLSLKTDLLIKIKTLNDTFSNMAKLQTFLQHDIKNIAQFVQTLSFNLQNIEDLEDEQRLVSYLKDSSAGLLLRANKIINTLEVDPEKGDEQGKNINIKESLENLIKSYNLNCKIKGDASIFGKESNIILIFDNILKNMYDKSLSEDLECNIEIKNNEKDVNVNIFDSGSSVPDIERIFEPFYTTKESGLGVGLYQVKSLLTAMGGKIDAENMDNGVRFEITLPK